MCRKSARCWGKNPQLGGRVHSDLRGWGRKVAGGSGCSLGLLRCSAKANFDCDFRPLLGGVCENKGTNGTDGTNGTPESAVLTRRPRCERREFRGFRSSSAASDVVATLNKMAMAAWTGPPVSAPSAPWQSAAAGMRPSSWPGWATSGSLAVKRKALRATPTRLLRRLATLRSKLFRLEGDLQQRGEEELCYVCVAATILYTSCTLNKL